MMTELTTESATKPAPPTWIDPREETGVAVLLPNGRLAGRTFASRAQAEAWARPEDGEQVVELNAICDCDI